MQKNPPKRRLGCLLFFLIFFLVLVFAFSEKLHTVRYTVETTKVTSPLRLVLLTDLHSCMYGEAQKDLLSAIAKEKPDAVCMVGDIFDDKTPHQGAMELLDGIADTYPCFFVTGNHEHWSAEDTVFKGLLASYGVTVLAGDVVSFVAGDQTVLLGGIDDPTGFVDMGSPGVPDKETWYGQLALTSQAAVDSPHFTILLSHRPEKTDAYTASPFDLVLSGHAHGGQVRLPFLPNGLFSPGEGYLPTYTGGVYNLADTTLIVSRGLCKNELPRVFNPPEVVVVNIVPAS